MSIHTSDVPNSLITTYLEMTDHSQFRPSFVEAADIRIERLDWVDVRFYRRLYRAVGEQWRWRDRLEVSADVLEREINASNVEIHVLYVGDDPAGYIELGHETDGSTEVKYFGLRSEYMGRGLGKHLLSYGVEQAWRTGARRVWLHTCNLDGPHALNNYRRRGFQPFMQHHEEMPDKYL